MLSLDVDVYTPGKLPDDVFYSCRKMLLDTSLQTQASPSTLQHGKLTSLPYAPDLTSAWRTSGTVFVLPADSATAVQAFLVAYGPAEYEAVLRLRSYEHKRDLVRLIEESQISEAPHGVFIIDLLIAANDGAKRNRLSRRSGASLLDEACKHFAGSHALAFISPRNTYMLRLAQLKGFRILAPLGACEVEVPNTRPLQPRHWVPVVRPSTAEERLSIQASSDSDPCIRVVYRGGQAYLDVPATVYRQARSAGKGGAHLLDNIVERLLTTSRFDVSSTELQRVACPFLSFNDAIHYDAITNAGRYSVLSRHLQRSTYEATQAILADLIQESAALFGGKGGLVLDIGASQEGVWQLPAEWCAHGLHAGNPLVLSELSFTSEPMLGADIILLIHTLIRLANFGCPEAGVHDYEPEAKQWFIDRLLAAAVSCGKNAVIVEPEIKAGIVPSIDVVSQVIKSAFLRLPPSMAVPPAVAEYWAASWWYALAERYTHPLQFSCNRRLQDVLDCREVILDDFGSELRDTCVRTFRSRTKLLYEVTFYDLHGKTERDFVPGMVSPEDFEEILRQLFLQNRITEVRFAAALDEHLERLDVARSGQSYLLVATDVAYEDEFVLGTEDCNDASGSLLSLLYPAGFVLDCHDENDRELHVWGDASLPHYLVGSYDIQISELHAWLRSRAQYAGFGQKPIVGLTVCRFVKEFGGYCTRSAVYLWDAEKVTTSHLLAVARELESSMNGFIERTIKGLFLSSRRQEAVAAIASQSLSHNIGSHALSDERLFDASKPHDALAVKDFHLYLQGRLDYVAQLIAKTPPQAEPMYLWRDILGEFLRQRLLLDKLVADRSVEGPNLSFSVTFPHSDKECIITWDQIEDSLRCDGRERMLTGPSRDVLVAVPGGSVGRHALFGIVENMMRNSAKYGQRKGGTNDLRIHFRLRAPHRNSGRGSELHDHWLLEMWDNFSGFKSNDKEARRYEELANSFMADVIDDEGRTRASGHGLIEIKEAMRFLQSGHEHRGNIDDGSPCACLPHCQRSTPAHGGRKCERWDCLSEEGDCYHANLANVFGPEYGGSQPRKNGDPGDGVLVYRVRLRRPRLLGVWAPGTDFSEARTEDAAEGVFFRNDASLTKPREAGAPSLVELAPHLLVIRDPRELNEKQIQQDIVREIAEQHWRLPYRLFVVVADDARKAAWERVLACSDFRVPSSPITVTAGNSPPPFLPSRRVRILIAPHLHEELADPSDRLGLGFVNRVYDHWLMAYKPRMDAKIYQHHDQWHLAVVFERNKETVEANWDTAKRLADNPLQSLSAAAYFKQSTKANASMKQKTEVKPVVGKMDWTVDADSVARLIHFGNHGASPPGNSLAVEKALVNNTIGFSQAFGLSEGPRTFTMLYAPPSDLDGFAFFCLTVVEAALTRVAVFDERVAGVYFADDDGDNGKLISKLRLSDSRHASLFPLLTAGSANAGCGPAVNSIDWDGMKARNGTTKPTLPSKECSGPVLQSDASLQIAAIKEADVVLLHEGLIEELVGNGGFQKGAEICIYTVAPHVVRTSGKGRDARQLGGFLPFCEYSAISAALAPLVRTDKGQRDECLRIEKITMAQSILNTVGRLPDKRALS